MLEIPTSLSSVTEELIYRTIGCCIEVHKALGPGLVEIAYERAVCFELGDQQIPFECERAVPIMYRGRPVHTHRLDIVVGDAILLELKAVDRLSPVHTAQVLSCLRAARLPVALLINFNVPVLPEGIKRVISPRDGGRSL
jgi:GxxExxY protein